MNAISYTKRLIRRDNSFKKKKNSEQYSSSASIRKLSNYSSFHSPNWQPLHTAFLMHPSIHTTTTHTCIPKRRARIFINSIIYFQTKKFSNPVLPNAHLEPNILSKFDASIKHYDPPPTLKPTISDVNRNTITMEKFHTNIHI